MKDTMLDGIAGIQKQKNIGRDLKYHADTDLNHRYNDEAIGMGTEGIEQVAEAVGLAACHVQDDNGHTDLQQID